MEVILQHVLHDSLRMLRVVLRMGNHLPWHQQPISVEIIVLLQRILPEQVGHGIVHERMDELHRHVQQIFHKWEHVELQMAKPIQHNPQIIFFVM